MEENSKFGYINTSGKMVIKPQFDDGAAHTRDF
ncbi:WG repeat-containing protein [Chlorogloeopsis fritschii]|nr:WG repeat-containing protein [Chlorogloeopsis fritschii]